MQGIVTKKNNNKLLRAMKIFIGTSDDLMFWALMDTLFLSVVKGLDAVQISLIFSIAYWIAPLLRIPCFYFLKKVDNGTRAMIACVLFLLASLALTFGNSMFFYVLGQILYSISPAFFDAADVMLKDVCRSSEPAADYVQQRLSANVMYTVISIVTALLLNPLMEINNYLPMYLCVAMRIFSLIYSFRVRSMHQWKMAETKDTGRPHSAPMRKSTKMYLICSIFVVVFLTLAGTNLKIHFQSTLGAVFPEDQVVKVFSYVILGTRFAKLAGNFLGKLLGKFTTENQKTLVLLAALAISCPALAAVSSFLSGNEAVLLAGVGLLLRFVFYDPLQTYSTNNLIDRLNSQQAANILFLKRTLLDVVKAFFSTIITFILAKSGMQLVLVLLSAIAFLILLFAVLGAQYKKKQERGLKAVWPISELQSDSLMTATLVLISQYGYLKSYRITPSQLESKIGEIGNISNYCPSFQFSGIGDYAYDKMLDAYSAGSPCAVYADDGYGFRWYPIAFADKDGALVYNCYSNLHFLDEFKDIEQLCCFTIKQSPLSGLMGNFRRKK